jgi:hypothetical protein
MAHAAELNGNNQVIRVIVVHNDYEPNIEDWAKDWAGGGNWKQTSYSGSIRKNFASIGYTYDEGRDAFIPPASNCHPDEHLDETTYQWVCTNSDHQKDTLG